MTDTTILSKLKTLDSAPFAVLSDEERRIAGAGKERILASDPEVPARRGRRSLPWLLAASVAAAALVGALVVTVDVGGSAYASWSPTPSPVTSDDTRIAEEACLSSARRPDARLVLTERRGDWVALAATTSEPAVVTCLVELPVGASRPGDVRAGVSGGQGAVPVGGEFTDGAISEHQAVGFFGAASPEVAAFNVGTVGPDVAAVTITTADGEQVEATVENGRFLAWWPGRAFGSETEGNGGAAPDLSYRLVLTDGTVIEDATPVKPE